MFTEVTEQSQLVATSCLKRVQRAHSQLGMHMPDRPLWHELLCTAEHDMMCCLI